MPIYMYMYSSRDPVPEESFISFLPPIQKSLGGHINLAILTYTTCKDAPLARCSHGFGYSCNHQNFTKIETETFSSYPVFHYLFPEGVTTIRLASLNDDYQKMLTHDSSAHQLKVTDSATGEIVAVGRWHIYRRPRSESELERDRERIWSPDARSDEDCQEFSDSLTEARKRVMGCRPHLRTGTSLTMAPQN